MRARLEQRLIETIDKLSMDPTNEKLITMKKDIENMLDAGDNYER